MPLGNELAENAQVTRKVAPGGRASRPETLSTSTSTPILLENVETEKGSEIERVRECGSERKGEGVKERKREGWRRMIHCKMGGRR